MPIINDLEIIGGRKTKLRFTVSGYKPLIPLANAIRRAPYELIPIYAISDIIYLEPNGSSAIDEYLEQRIKAIPIWNEKLDEKTLETLSLELNVSCNSELGCDVLSSDFKVVGADSLPMHPDHLIVTLKKGQKINISCRLSKGYPEQHERFQSICGVDYHYPEKAGEEPKKITLVYRSNGALSPKTMLLGCIQAIGNEASNIGKAFKEKNEEKIRVFNTFGQKYEIKLTNTTITIGNLLAQIIGKQKGVLMSSCVKIHPLLNFINIVVALESGTIEEALQGGIEEMVQLMGKLEKEV